MERTIKDPRVGQKIEIICAEHGARGANNHVGTIVSIGLSPRVMRLHGIISSSGGIYVDINHYDYGQGVWNIGYKASFKLIDTEWDAEGN